MPTSVTMPALGESVTEGTVTRWLKQEGERVETDEPLLEVSTDKVDTEIPSPAGGILTKIKVSEDETVEVGVELAVIDESGSGEAGGGAGGDSDGGQPASPQPAQAESALQQPETQAAEPEPEPQREPEQQPEQPAAQQPEPEQPAAQQPEPEQPAAQQPEPEQPAAQQPEPEQQQDAPRHQAPEPPAAEPQSEPQPEPQAQAPQPQTAPAPPPEPTRQPQQAPPPPQPAPQAPPPTDSGPSPSAGVDSAGAYVTPLVRKLASEHNVDLNEITGSGVGGRIRKQDVLDAAKAAQDAAQQAADEQEAASRAQAPAPAAAEESAPAGSRSGAAAPTPSPAAQALRGNTEKLSRLRSLIATRMVESLQTSAQLTTVVEVDVTAIARLRQRAKAEFERQNGVKLSFLPFFALTAVEALKAHPKLNASIDSEAGTVTYHAEEHLGVAVDTERGLAVPVIHGAGDLNLSGLARKIADLAERTRANKVSPDELGGGTFTITNTGSRGALFDTPIINQPQVAILGTGSVVKRPVVIDDPELGEVISVRSMVYLALTYDHRLVDGADAARFLVALKERLEGGAFEAEVGLG